MEVVIIFRFQRWPWYLCLPKLEVRGHWIVAGILVFSLISCRHSYEIVPMTKQVHVLCQVKSGTLFDNVLICDDPEYAKKLAEETWGKQKDVCCLLPLKSMLLSNISSVFWCLGLYRFCRLRRQHSTRKRRRKKRRYCICPLLLSFNFLLNESCIFPVHYFPLSILNWKISISISSFRFIWCHRSNDVLG